MKTCSMCLVLKSLDCFSVNRRNKSDGRQSKCKDCDRQYYLNNQEKIVIRVNKHYHSNNEQILTRRIELRTRPEAKIKKTNENIKYYLKKKDSLREYYKEWINKNREHVRAYRSAYRFKRLQKIIKNGNNTLTLDQIKSLLISHPYCEYCGSKDNLSIDHIIPVARGGQNCVLNITVACRKCNSSKNDKLISEWNKIKESQNA